MIEEYENNIKKAIELVKEIAIYSAQIQTAKPDEKAMISRIITALKNRIKIINNSMPELLKSIEVIQKLPNSKLQEKKLKKITLERDGNKQDIMIDKKYKQDYMKELEISEESLKKIYQKNEKNNVEEETIKSRRYLRLSNRLFLNISKSLVKRGYFRYLSNDLKKANMNILVEVYVSMMFLSGVIAFIVGTVISLGLIFIEYSPQSGFEIYSEGYVLRAMKVALIPFVLGIITSLLIYLYPKTEKKDTEKKINQELPFAVVHMSSIAGSGIEPSEIFKIIALSPEYPALGKEIRKILNQINVYGYDLVTSLSNSAKNSPSQKLAELFSGLSTTITSGGSLADFFKKRAESLVMEYRLEREKFTKVAETSMDLYITIVIAAPMILLLIFILLSISKFAENISPLLITLMIIGMIAIINVIFLSILNIKQPQY